MLQKLYGITAVATSVCAAFFYILSGLRGHQIDILTRETEQLTSDLKRCQNETANYIEATERAQATIGSIRTVIKQVPSPCDCYHVGIDESVITRVRGE